MWCTIDQVDVDGDSPALQNDDEWGWIHQSRGTWHTLTGTRLQQTGHGFDATTRGPVLPIAPEPGFEAHRSVPNLVDDPGDALGGGS